MYIADTAYLPYGEKTAEFLIQRAEKITHYLKDYGITTIVIACHTSAATSLNALKKKFPEITFIDPLPMTTDDALATTKNGRIGIMATERSISTGMHKKLLHNQNLNVEVIEQPCPLFVPLIENNKSSQEVDAVVRLYSEKMRISDIDTVILGCTHYPFIEQQIQKYLPGITLISGASAIKKQIPHAFDNKNIESQKIRFVVSGDIEKINPLLEKYVLKKNGLSLSIAQLEKPYYAE